MFDSQALFAPTLLLESVSLTMNSASVPFVFFKIDTEEQKTVVAVIRRRYLSEISSRVCDLANFRVYRGEDGLPTARVPITIPRQPPEAPVILFTTMVVVTSQNLRMIIGADELPTVGPYIRRFQHEKLWKLDGVMVNIPKEIRRAPEEAQGAYDDGSDIDLNEEGTKETPGKWAASPSTSATEPLNLRKPRLETFSSDVEWASTSLSSGIRDRRGREISTPPRTTAAPPPSPASPPTPWRGDVTLSGWDRLPSEWEEPTAGPSWAATPPRRESPTSEKPRREERAATPAENKTAKPDSPLVILYRNALAEAMGRNTAKRGRARGSKNRTSVIPRALKKKCSACQRREQPGFKPRRGRNGLWPQQCWECKDDIIYPDEM